MKIVYIANEKMEYEMLSICVFNMCRHLPFCGG